VYSVRIESKVIVMLQVSSGGSG